MSTDNLKPQTIRRVKSRPSRVRDASPPGADAGEEYPSSATPESLATKLKNRQKRLKPKARLSFGTDDQSSDGEVFKVKKSNLSRKLVLGNNTPLSTPSGEALPSNLDQASISPRSDGPTYTKAYLDELKANTPSTPATRQGYEDIDFDSSLDLDGAMIETGADLLPESIIPSASAINAAKEKRNRLRGTEGNNDDFISLSVAKSGDMPSGPHPESRLMREEDELGEGEDDMAEYTGAQERIALGKKGQKEEARKKRMGMAEMIEDANEDDEETKEWELAQIRRAGPVVEEPTKKPKPTYQPAPIPLEIPVPTLDASLARLTAAMTNLTTSHASNTATLTSLAEERLALESKEAEMRQMVEKAEMKRSWFTAFREWIESVANFLDEKYPSLERLEDEHISLIAERRDMISDRRKLDDEDDIALFLGLPPAATTETPAEEMEVMVDELGRTVPSNNNTVKATRVSRRNARSNRRILRRARNQTEKQEEEGYSTDGSLPPADADDYRIAIAKLEERGEGILSDVRADEFRDPQLGLAKWFGEWRETYKESYIGAWGGLGLVAAWEFWSRLEMVGWDPIEEPSRGLDTFEWAVALHEYSRPPQKDAEDMELENNDIEPEIGPGGDMVSSMISQTVIPRLCKLIEGGALDPYSTRHVRRMIDVAEQVEASVEQGGARFQSLLKSVSTVFQDAVAALHTLLSPSLGPANRGPAFDPHSIPARRRFLTRRLKLLTNILKWRKYTGDQFGLGEAVTSLLQRCILPVAERGWDVGGEELMRKVVESTPPELVPAEVIRRLR